MPTQTLPYQPGDRVRVTQRVTRGVRFTDIAFEGVVLRAGQQKTGSWFAHAKDKKLWLDRLELAGDDGEIIVVNLDQHSRVEKLG